MWRTDGLYGQSLSYGRERTEKKGKDHTTTCLNIMWNAVDSTLQLLYVFLSTASSCQLRAGEIVVPNKQGIAAPFPGRNVFSMAKENTGYMTGLQNLSTHQLIKCPLKDAQLIKIDIRMCGTRPLMGNENGLPHPQRIIRMWRHLKKQTLRFFLAYDMTVEQLETPRK